MDLSTFCAMRGGRRFVGRMRSALLFLYAGTVVAVLCSAPKDVAGGASPIAQSEPGAQARGAHASPQQPDPEFIAPGNDQPDAALSAVRAAEARRIDVFAHAAKAVVSVFSDNQHGGGGSGVIIDPKGYGLTNFHVVQPFVESRRGFAGLSDGRLYPLTVIGIDPGGDIVVFKLEGKPRFDYAPLGDSDVLRVGQRVAAMGNPFMLAEDYSPTITLGVISGLHRYQKGRGNLLEYADCIQVSTSINPGNSGGPLFDLEGRVIGINGRASFEERGRVNVGLGYAVSINQIKRFMPGLKAGRMLEHGTLGATVRGIGSELLVDAVQDFSAAERAGVQLGDELLELAGRRLRTANDYNNILATLPASWPVTLKLRRDGELLETTARLDRLPLRMPLTWLVDLDHNHRELLGILDGHAQRARTRFAQPFSRVTFEGRIRETTGSRADHSGGSGRPFTVSVDTETAEGVSLAETGPQSNEPLDSAVRYEWTRLAHPLLARPQIDLSWELLVGDEVDGRIVNVVECRYDADRRVRWKFDWQTDELLLVTVGNQEQPSVVVWTPATPEQFGSIVWPSRWTRRTQAGDEAVVEIESIPPEPQLPNEAPGEATQKEAGG
jgi:S1-C subfamily serine protease